MLNNVPISSMKEKVITEAYDWRSKGIVELNENYMGANSGQMDVYLERNAVDGSFDLMQKTDFSQNEGSRSFVVNDKEIEVGAPGEDGSYKMHSSMDSSTPLDKAKHIAAQMKWAAGHFLNFVTFPQEHPFDKNVVLGPNEYLLLRSIDKVHFSFNVTQSDNKISYFKAGDPKITYTETYLVPKALDVLNPSQDLFDIYVKDGDGDLNDLGDIGYSDGTMTTSGTGSTKFKLKTVPTADVVGSTFNVPRVSTIKTFDWTTYDYEKHKVSVGYGSDSEKGVIVPYNYKGQYKRTFDISPNEPFEHMNITLTNQIDTPTLDPYEGKVMLDINSIDHKKTDDIPMVDWNVISSDNFEKLKDIDPTLIGMQRLTHEDNI